MEIQPVAMKSELVFPRLPAVALWVKPGVLLVSCALPWTHVSGQPPVYYYPSSRSGQFSFLDPRNRSHRGRELPLAFYFSIREGRAVLSALLRDPIPNLGVRKCHQLACTKGHMGPVTSYYCLGEKQVSLYQGRPPRPSHWFCLPSRDTDLFFVICWVVSKALGQT